MGENNFSRLFPSLQEAPIQPTPTSTDIVEILARILPIEADIQPPRQTDGEENQSDNTPEASNRFGITTPDLKALLQMCGKSTDGSFDSLPTWFQQCG